jgi:hypothetical protein
MLLQLVEQQPRTFHLDLHLFREQTVPVHARALKPNHTPTGGMLAPLASRDGLQKVVLVF